MRNITTNHAITYTNMTVRLNFCFKISCTLLQYFDFSPPGPSSHAILVQTEPRLQDFIINFLKNIFPSVLAP